MVMGSIGLVACWWHVGRGLVARRPGFAFHTQTLGLCLFMAGRAGALELVHGRPGSACTSRFSNSGLVDPGTLVRLEDSSGACACPAGVVNRGVKSVKFMKFTMSNSDVESTGLVFEKRFKIKDAPFCCQSHHL